MLVHAFRAALEYRKEIPMPTSARGRTCRSAPPTTWTAGGSATRLTAIAPPAPRAI